MKAVEIGLTSTGKPIALALSANYSGCLISASSGWGKSNLLRVLILQLAREMREAVQFVVLDGKCGGEFERFSRRCLVVSDERDFPRVLSDLHDFMMRRYAAMRESGERSAEPTAERPLVCVVVDEPYSVTNSPGLTKAEKASMVETLELLATKARAAGMCLVFASQDVSTKTFSPVVRMNCSTRIIMHTDSLEQVDMLTLGRKDEAPAAGLTRPGEFYLLGSETHGRFVRGRTWLSDEDSEERLLASLERDRRDVGLEWQVASPY